MTVIGGLVSVQVNDYGAVLLKRLQADIVERTQCLRTWQTTAKKELGFLDGKGDWKTPLELYIIIAD